MEINVKPYTKRGKVGLMVEFTIPYPDGLPPYRVKKKTPFPNSERESRRWGEKLFLRLYQEGRPKTREEKRRLKEEATQAQEAPAKLTFGAFATKWLEEYVVAEQLARGTYELRERVIRLFLLPLFQERDLDSFGVADYQLLKSKYRLTAKGKPRGKEQINSFCAQLYQMLSHAVDWRCATQLPPKPKRLKVERVDVEPLSPQEYERLVKAAKESCTRDLCLVLLAGDAGLRAGEMRGLRWTDIDLTRKELRVRQQETGKQEVKSPKSKKSRVLPMTTRLAEALKAHRHLCERVLINPYGRPLSMGGVRLYLVRLQKKVKLPPKGPHQLRHTFASRCVAAGVDVRELQELLGHSSLLTTERYVHLLKGHTRVAIEKLEAFGGDQTETEVGK